MAPSQPNINTLPTKVVNKLDIQFLLHPPTAQLRQKELRSSPRQIMIDSRSSISSMQASPIKKTSVLKHCSFRSCKEEKLDGPIRHSHNPLVYTCNACEKSFTDRASAKKHHSTAHVRKGNHKCPNCDRRFALQDSLKRHVSVVHLNHRPFECTECMCPGGPHSQAEPCTHICGSRFRQNSHRRRHLLRVHRISDGQKKSVTLPSRRHQQ